MKIAHILTVHKGPLQVEKLVKRLVHVDADVYIHIDQKIDINKFSFLSDCPSVKFIKNRIVCNWGGFSFVHAILNSIHEVIYSGIVYDYINLLSGQDYPLKPIDDFHQFLISNLGKSFISYEVMGQSDWWKHAVTRYEMFHFTDNNFKGRYLVQSFVNKISPKRKFPLDYQLFGSANSSWWTLHYDCAKYIIEFVSRNKRLMRFMKMTWGADEFLFPTILMNSGFKNRIINNNLRLIEWEEGCSNPQIYTSKDIDMLKYSEYFFARKFDVTIDSQILDILDDESKLY